MDPQDIRTLHLLEEIEKNEMPSQRHLAKQLNISLGLVNSFIKRLAQKGYFKVTTIPKNRVKYILTPKGAAEKTRLTYKYIKYSYTFYKNAREKLRVLFRDFEAEGVRRIVFVGAGDLTEIAYLSLLETSIVLVGIVDDASNGKTLFDYHIQPSDEIEHMDFDKILITDLTVKDKIFRDAQKVGLHRDAVAVIE